MVRVINLTHFEPGLAEHTDVSGDGGQAPVRVAIDICDMRQAPWAHEDRSVASKSRPRPIQPVPL